MDPRINTTAESVDPVFFFILGINIIILIGVVVTLIYFVIRYNRKRCPVPEETKEDIVWLELSWTIIPTIIVLSMFWFGWEGYLSLRRVPADAMEVQVSARKWSWLFTYENGKTSNKLYVPVGKPVKVRLLSEDVIHSFFVPAFRVKRDCVPGMENYAWFVADEVSSYNVFCAEYCGVGHADMVTTVEAVTEEEFEEWMQPESESEEIPPGLALLEKYDCTKCHPLDGSRGIGPSLKGVFNRQVTVKKDGQEITFTSDRDYLLRSIREPKLEIVLGFPSVMPTIELSNEEFYAIIAILLKL